MNNKIDEKVIDMIEKYIFTLENKYKIFSIKEDAFNEAILAYYKAIEDYNPRKGNDIRKWVYLRIWNTLNAFYKKERNLELTTDGHNAVTGNKVIGADHYFGYDDIICEAMQEVINSLNNLEKVIYLSYLEGESLLQIKKKVDYPKEKIKHIATFIDKAIQERVKSVMC